MVVMELAFIGLIICSLAIGHEYSAFHGWMVLGGGMVVIGTIDAIITYISRRE
jgi:hypothetical protein